MLHDIKKEIIGLKNNLTKAMAEVRNQSCFDEDQKEEIHFVYEYMYQAASDLLDGNITVEKYAERIDYVAGKYVDSFDILMDYFPGSIDINYLVNNRTKR